MYEKVLYKIWLQMKQARGLDEDDRELYLFGVSQGAILLLNILTSLCIGITLNMLLEIIAYLVCFIPLRIFAGGYHAKTQFRCYIMSSFATAAVLLSIRFLQNQTSIWEIVCFCIAFLVIWHFAPVADANKPLTQVEYDIYRKKVRKRLVCVTGIAGVLWAFRIYEIMTVIEVAVCFLAIILLGGLFKGKTKMIE